ncbi:MAG TPA: YDG domain-containing protein, partial [Candidatus Limnocylindrales bacterium]|nr:YDG domain-containing protein [Candidatus Limnocylindrales bacterium]
LATFHNDTYFAATTGYLNVSSDTRTTPTVTAWPTANSIVYGQTLASAALSGGSASVPGTFAFTTPSTAPNAGTAPQSVTFTPTDLSTYTTTNFSVSVTVAKANPTVTAWPTANSITYGQTLASATLSGGSATPAGSFAFTTPSTAPNAGTAPQSVTYTPIDIANYNTASSTVSVTVAKANPNVTAWPTASAITYGQTLASSTLTGGSATPAGSFAFTTPTTAPNAGTAAQSVTYLPTDTANYNTASSTVSVTVNKADPNVTAWPSATAITYGQTLASSTLSGGSATPAGSFAFTTPTTAPNAGTAAQSVTYTPTDTANYNTASSTVSVTVNPKALTVTGITADNKPYDGNTTATLNTAGAALVGKVGTDDVTLNTAGATGAFADSNVGNGKSVQVSGLTLGGADMGNYTLTQPSVSANITQAGLTVAGIEAENKVYDGTDTATLILSNAVLVGVVSGDTVTLDTNNAAGVFADKNVGTSKVVTISGLALLGADAAKYTLTQPATNADITQASLTVTGITASDKPYDGNTTATLDTTSAALNGVFSGDDVTLNTASAAGAFSDANAGSAKAVQVSGLSISGGDAPNYALTQPTLSANITPADPVVTEWPTATPIIYGQTLASSTLSGGSATPAGSFAFTTPSTTPGAGTATQSVTYTPTDTANYNTASSTVLVTVNPKALTVTGITANDKVYDGNTTATLNTVSAALVGKVGADDVTLNTASASGDFSDANVGTGKTVQVSGLTLGGTDMGNYALTQPTLTASITSPSPGNIDDGLSVWIVLDTGSHYLEMSFRRNKNAAAMGLQYSPQVSGDKQTWFSDNSHVSELSVVPFDSQFDLVTVRALSPITTLAPRFARLIVVATVPSPVQTTSQVWIGTDTAIQGNGGSGTKFTTFSQRMIRPIAAAGTVSSLQNSILTDTNATWTDGQFGTNGIRSYVEFDSGLSADIANSSGGSHTLTLAGSPGGIVSIGDPYRIRSHFTIASLFGTNNETGLKTAQNPAQADNILLQIPETQQTLTIFYFSNSAAQLWLRADFSAASNQIIYPEQGVLVRRIAPGNLDLFASGPVKSGSAIVPVEQGFNLLGTLQSINSLSISALGLYTGSPLTGIASGLNPTAADNLLVVQPDGSTATYFYFKDTHGNESWLDPSFNSANAVPINPGSAFFIHRKPANPAFNWSMPAQ